MALATVRRSVFRPEVGVMIVKVAWGGIGQEPVFPLVAASTLLRRLWRGGRQVVALADPTPELVTARLERRRLPITVAVVYRSRNAANVVEMVAPVVAAGASVRLWSLDDVPGSLARWTLGTGPGRRFELLNRLLADAPAGWSVLADDDVRFRRRNLLDLVQIAGRLGLDISQPAHALGSNVSHSFTRTAPFCVARLTSFVEIGPVVVFSPAARPHVFPLPEDGMGWGTEVAWSDLQRTSGLKLAIVDAVRIDHLGAIGDGYSSESEWARLRGTLADHDLQDWSSLQRTHRRIRPWNLSSF
jgi:hypothetical protein